MEGSKSVIIDDDVLKCIRLAHVRASVKFLQGHPLYTSQMKMRF